MRKRILVIGFGNMGCRHVQSLLSAGEKFEIHVVEPMIENVRINSQRIGAIEGDFVLYNSMNELKMEFDLAIVATSASPRFRIVDFLLKYGVKYFLLEKIVFQTNFQFHQIISSLERYKAQAYCNFVNRYIDGYNYVKNLLALNPKPIRMIVQGGDFGLACNAIHYIDLFQYITNSKEAVISDSKIQLSEQSNKRGGEYREFTGSIAFANERKDELYITADNGSSSGVVITIEWHDQIFSFSEQTQKSIHFDGGKINSSDFTILPTSKLTARIVDEIFINSCRLTQNKETAFAHSELFHLFNKVLSGTTDDDLICPIT